jgi:CrcB protein
MTHFILVALGGAIGAASRYALTEYAIRWTWNGMPLGVFSANIIGSFLMGALFGWYGVNVDASNEWRLFLGVGVLGGFTTYSTFALETMTLIRSGDWMIVACYALGMFVLSLVMVMLGAMITSGVFSS